MSLSISKLAFIAPIAALAIAAPSRPASADVAWGAHFHISGGGARFAPELAAYGQWMVEPRYGSVFIPDDRTFVPYTQGHWIDGDAGLTWVSDSPFGEQTEHYGRWVMTRYGWAWIPGSEYSPAWVEWRDAGDHVGWAPLGPDGAIADPGAWHFVPAAAVRARILRPYYQPGARDYPRSRVFDARHRFFELERARGYARRPYPRYGDDYPQGFRREGWHGREMRGDQRQRRAGWGARRHGDAY